MSMSPAYSSDPPASRTWWSLGLRHSSQNDLQRQSSHKSPHHRGLNSIAVALGFKSKKHPVLAIQDPGSPSRPTMPTIVERTHNRPPSKSVSSTQSQVDSPGPRTPEDPQRDSRQSLFTISDSDPFAVVRAISSAPRSPSLSSRLAPFTNSSNSDIMSKNTEPILNRVSYASSSSQSNTHGNDLPPLGSINDLPKKSKPNLHRKQSASGHGDQSLGSAWESLKSAHNLKSGPPTIFFTGADKNRTSQSAVTLAPCSPMHATGMNDPSQRLTAPSSLLSHSPSNPSSRTVVRQVSRTRLPPSTPPRQGLPPPPSVQDHRARDDEAEPAAHVSTDSVSSSSLSFASSISSPKDILYNYSPRKRDRAPLEHSISSSARLGSGHDAFHRGFSSSSPHTLKKATSHQSLGRRLPPPTSSVPIPLPELPSPSKAPRKQRSFHHAKFPLPPLSPKRSSTSSGSQISTPITDPNTEQRRGSGGGFSLPVRKRLFSTGSNNRRPSTSASIVPEDDNQSVFSSRSVPEQSIGTAIFKPLGQPLSPNPNSSFWDEASLPDQTPSSPRIVTHDYTPQQIMSPAEMAKLEASVNNLSTLDHPIQRGSSALSTSTAASMISDRDPGTSVVESLSVADVTSIHSVPNRPISGSTSLVQKGLSTPLRRGVQPSTSQVSMTTSAVSERSWGSLMSSSPGPSITSLPPPPRRARPRATFVNDNPNPSLPPPPGRRSIRPRISVEETLHRRSIMRKPSFLEIDDDSDKDTDIESLGEPPSGSFLDLARESFDIASE